MWYLFNLFECPDPKVSVQKTSGPPTNIFVDACLDKNWNLGVDFIFYAGPKSVPTLFQVLGSRLLILSASPEDSGEYICRVEDNTGQLGSHVHQASVSVSVTSSSSREFLCEAVNAGSHVWMFNTAAHCRCCHQVAAVRTTGRTGRSEQWFSH